MATTKPRITITITHRQHELLKAISEATGASMSANVSELLETCEPVLERIANTMQKLQSINAQRKASVAAALDEAQSALEPVMDAALGQFDLFSSRLERAAAGDGDARAASGPAPAAARIPRPVITGDKTPRRGSQKAGKAAGPKEEGKVRKGRSHAV